ncbi:MAG TPA: hypothetical protein VGM18_07180 [Candidatus Sulfotelmatobacter sp.]|jgi:hypothetical protein
MPYIAMGLTDADVEFGKNLWHELRVSQRFPIAGMFWLLDGEWHLVIASPVVDELGPRDSYRKLAEIVRLNQGDSARLLRVQLISPRNPLYEALRSVFGKTASVEGARLGGSQVGGMYIEDAYLYGVR